jgi:hypothetical protein
MQRLNWGTRRYNGYAGRILGLLDRRFLYVTIAQADNGIGVPWRGMPRNLLVFSHAGRGHVPLLFWLGEESAKVETRAVLENQIVLTHSSNVHWAKKVFGEELADGSAGKWREIGENATFVLVVQRVSSYRLAEVLQRGLVPVYVYGGDPWLPYTGAINWEEFSVPVSFGSAEQIAPEIRKMGKEKAARMREKLQELRETHFTPQGVWAQLFAFFQGGEDASDLRCVRRK